MVQIDLTTWGPIYGAAIIAIGFSFFASMYIQTKLRLQELQIKLGAITREKALEETASQYFWAKILFIVLLLIVGLLYVLIFFVSIPQSPTGNITNTCENCTYPVTNIINNYNVTVTVICEKNTNPSFSVEELKHLMGKKPVPKVP